jgi:ABC-type sugar transport system ATPase subunit
MAEVIVRKLNKMFDTNHVVKDVDLHIRDKEFVVFVGPSGCGKTTTLRMIAGLEAITSGDILIGNTVVNQVPPMDRDIAMVFQNYALYPHMSVASNMAFGLKMRKFEKPEIEKRIKRAAEILGIGELLHRKPRQLSGGQRQRVALGRAIVRDPKVFLFDEPLSNLDAKLRVQMRLEIKRLQRELGVTSIYVTHDQVEAMTLADRLIVMNAGVADQIGTPMDVYDRPASVFVAGFIGSPAMNFLAAKVGQDGKSVDLAGTNTNGAINMPLARPTSAPVGSAVALGVRPEHLHPAADGALQFEVELAEPLGADTLLHGRFGAARELVTVRQGGHVIARPGEMRHFKAEPGHLHLFDSQTGKRFADT